MSRGKPKLLFSLFLLIFICGFFGFADKVFADYETVGAFTSTNVLSGFNAEIIDSFTYTITIPAGSTAAVQFSTDNTDWYNSSGTFNGLNTLSAGTNIISLSARSWEGNSFYYKIIFTSDGTVTPSLDSVILSYTDLNGTYNIYNTTGSLTSTNLLSGLVATAINSFTYNVSSLPPNTTATIQFSIDNSTWYNSAGDSGGSDNLSAGINTIDLSARGWSGYLFYYKISLTSDGVYTPVVDSITLNYSAPPTTAYWVGNSGNWSDAANHWATTSGGTAGAGNLPGLTTNVIFDTNSGTGTATVNGNVEMASFTHSQTGLTVAIGTYNFAVTGASSVTNGTATIGISATNGWTTAGLTIGASGTVTATGAAKVTLTSGNFDQSSTSSRFNASTATITVNGNGTFTANGTLDSTQYNSATLVLNGTNTLTYGNLATYATNGFNNLTTGQATLTTTLASAVAIKSVLTVGSGILTGAGGLVYLNGNTPLSVDAANSRITVSRIYFYGSTQSIPSLTNGYGCDMSVSNPGSIVTQTGNIAITGFLSINVSANASATATWLTDGYNLTVGGNITIGAGADSGLKKIDATRNGARTSTITVGGNWLNYGTGTAPSQFIADDSTVIFNAATGTQTLTSGTTNSPFYNLTHSGAGTLSLSDALVVTGALTNSAGTFTANTKTATVTGLTTVSGGTYTPSSATQTFNGGLTLSGGNMTLTASNVAVNGNLSVSNSSTLAIATYDFAVTGASSVTNGTVTIGISATNGWTTAGLTVGAGGTVTATGASKVTLTSGNFDQSSTSSRFNASTATITVNGNGTFTADGTVDETQYNSATIVLNGTNTLTYDHVNSWANGFGNFTCGQGGNTTTLAENLTVMSVLTVGSGTLTNSVAKTVELRGATPLSFDANSRISVSILRFWASSITIPTLSNGYDSNIEVKGTNTTVTQTGDIVLNSTKYLLLNGWGTVGAVNTWKTDGYNLTVGGNLQIGQGSDTGLKKLDATHNGARTSTITVGGNWLNYGTGTAPSQFIADDSTVILTGTGASGTITSGTANSPFYNLTQNGTGGTYTLQDALVVSHNLTITSGTLDTKSGSNYAVSVAGNWLNSGTFTPQWGTVTLNGTSQKVFGSTNFYNLTKDVSAGSADKLMFQQSNTQTIASGGTLNLKGGSGKVLTLRGSDASGNETSGDPKWGLNVNNTNTTLVVDYVDVKDSDASAGKQITQTHSTDGGNNLNWALNTAPSFTALSTSPDLAGLGSNITFSSTAVDSDIHSDNSTDTVSLYVCKLNDFTGTVCGAGGEWCHSSASASNPSCVYTITSSDASGAKNYYGYIIDSHSLASSSNPITSTFTTDIEPPVPSGFDPAQGVRERASGLPSSVAFTLDEIGYCRSSSSDLAYSQMTSDCSGGGTTSIICNISSISQIYLNAYISCQDALGNESTIENNTLIHYNIPSDGSGAPAPAYFSPIIETVIETVKEVAQTAVEQVKDIPQQIVEIPQKTVEKVKDIVKEIEKIVDVLKPEPIEQQIAYPPIEELVPRETPLVFQNPQSLIFSPSFENFVLAPLPKSIQSLIAKFPELENTFKELGISKMTNLQEMRATSFNLPTLSEILPQLNQGISLSKIPENEKSKVPNSIVFASMAGEKIELNVKVFITDQGEPIQTISAIQNQTVTLSVKPEYEAETVKGYIIFKGKNGPVAVKESSEIPFIAGLVALLTQPKERDLVLDIFDYTDPDKDGIYTADVTAPAVDADYEIRTIINYKDSSIPPEELSMIMVVDPEGYVYRKINDSEESRIKGGVVSIYWLNPETKQYELWPAKDFLQDNPQTTDAAGKYSFLVPEGYYYLKVEHSLYAEWQSEPFQVQQGSGVHTNIELKPKNWLASIFNPSALLIGVALLVLSAVILVSAILISSSIKRKKI